MNSTLQNNMLAEIIKSNPGLETILQKMSDDNRQANSLFVHELRNPLTLIKGTLQYIELKHPETKDFKYWDQLSELVQDMENLMTDASMLNNFNITKKEPTDLLAMIENVTNSFMPQAFSKKIDLSFEADPGCVEFVSCYSCDSAKLKQALINLIKNAFEATSPGNFIHVLLKYIPESPASAARIAIEISDNGQSIPAQALETIFVPFITYKKGGTGVGLALVKKVVEMHFGSISVESDDSVTTFTISLPL